MPKIPRRDFLKAAPVAAGAIAAARATILADAGGQANASIEGRVPRISDAAYSPIADYPIRSKPYFEVTIRQGFWKRRIDTNADVTIPFEVQKLTETPRGLNGNVLEAAILSLKTHPNPQLQ